jgi:hypothetical protein
LQDFMINKFSGYLDTEKVDYDAKLAEIAKEYE